MKRNRKEKGNGQARTEENKEAHPSPDRHGRERTGREDLRSVERRKKLPLTSGRSRSVIRSGSPASEEGEEALYLTRGEIRAVHTALFGMSWQEEKWYAERRSAIRKLEMLMHEQSQ